SALLEDFTRGMTGLGFPILTYVIFQEAANILFRGVIKQELWYMVPEAILAALLLAFLFDRASSYGGRLRVSSIATAMALSAFALFTWIYRIDERSYAGYLGAR